MTILQGVPHWRALLCFGETLRGVSNFIFMPPFYICRRKFLYMNKYS